jgi:hypothetical protein
MIPAVQTHHRDRGDRRALVPTGLAAVGHPTPDHPDDRTASAATSGDSQNVAGRSGTCCTDATQSESHYGPAEGASPACS